jgi:hypothetical protein
MKEKKALKRLAKIEAWMSEVRDRYSAVAPNLLKALQHATAAVAQAKEAVSLHASGTKVAPAKAAKATAKTVDKRMPIKKAAKKRAARQTASASAVQAATKAAAK